MRKLALLLFVLLPVAAGPRIVSPDKEIDRLRKLAQRFEERGRAGDAKRTLIEALGIAPRSPGVFSDLLRLTTKQPDEFLMWAHLAAARLTDEKGALKNRKGIASEAQRLLQPSLKAAQIRAGAVDRMASHAKRLRRPREGAAARYLQALFRAATHDAAALRDKHAKLFADALTRCAPGGSEVLSALERGMKKALSEGRAGEAMKAAHILRGACVQARRTKLKVKRLKGLETSAVMVMRRVRKEAAAAAGPLGIEDLLEIAPKDRPQWEAAHSTWANPTVVLSPNGLYRIESVCGVRTTLMAALDVEYQHRRLAKWFSKDPFVGVPGTVRLCRSPADLEGEGQPHYWAGGFQSGNTTTIVVNASGRGGLAGTLTHELTHRFDGRLLPGMPGWLVEGRAVYTAGASLWARAESIDARAANFGAFYKSMTKGYRQERNLRKLIEGTPDDYRDNYTAGYSLWVYLTRYRARQYAARVPGYLKSFRAKPGWPAMQRFNSYFLDGKQGRPKKLAPLAQDFGRFLDEGGSIDTVEWKKQWRQLARAARTEANDQRAKAAAAAGGKELGSPYDSEILDRSNWNLFRRRSDDPIFGERHAYAAGLWLESQNNDAAAAVAFAWAAAVDELEAAQLEHIAALHARRGNPAVAWLHRLEARGRAIHEIDLGGRTPAPVVTLQQLVRPLLNTWRDNETSHRARGFGRAARMLLAERAMLARAAGIELKNPAADDAEPLGKDRLPPDCGPFTSVLAGGVVKGYWAPAESNINNNWHIPAPGRLVLGLSKPRKETSGFKRDAGVRKVFVRTRETYDQTYTFRVRVKFISAHLGGAIVFGQTRKDRGLVLHLNGGDWAYAVGRKKEGFGFRGISVRLDDLRAYDSGVTSLWSRIRFRTPKTSCLLTVRVSGSFVRVRVDDQEACSHRTATGIPIAGPIGFYLGSGLVGFDNPEVRRHRVIGAQATCPCEHADAPIDFNKPCRIDWKVWQGRRVLGVPKDPLGTFLLCYPKKTWKEHDAVATLLVLRKNLKGSEARLKAVYPKNATVPEEWPKAILFPHSGLRPLLKAREAWVGAEAKRESQMNKRATEQSALRRLRGEGPARPPWIAIDPHGIIRSRAVWTDPWWGGPPRNLLRRLRGH